MLLRTTFSSTGTKMIFLQTADHILRSICQMLLRRTVVLQRQLQMAKEILLMVLDTVSQQAVRIMMHSSIHGILVGIYIRRWVTRRLKILMNSRICLLRCTKFVLRMITEILHMPFHFGLTGMTEWLCMLSLQLQLTMVMMRWVSDYMTLRQVSSMTHLRITDHTSRCLSSTMTYIVQVL